MKQVFENILRNCAIHSSLSSSKSNRKFPGEGEKVNRNKFWFQNCWTRIDFLWNCKLHWEFFLEPYREYFPGTIQIYFWPSRVSLNDTERANWQRHRSSPILASHSEWIFKMKWSSQSEWRRTKLTKHICDYVISIHLWGCHYLHFKVWTMFRLLSLMS